MAGGCYAARRGAQAAQRKVSQDVSGTNVVSTGKVDTVTQLMQELSGRKDIELLADQFLAIGQPVIPRLIQRLEEGANEERFRVIYVLERMKVPPAKVIPVLEKILDENGTDRMHVALELQKLCPDSEKAVHILSEELQKGDAQNRIIITRTLSLSPNEKYVPALLDLITDADRGVRMAVLQTLGEIAVHSDTAGSDMVPALMKALGDPSATIRCLAARNLGIIGPSAKSAVPVLEKMAGDKNEKVVKAASDALLRINVVKKQKTDSKKSMKDLIK